MRDLSYFARVCDAHPHVARLLSVVPATLSAGRIRSGVNPHSAVAGREFVSRGAPKTFESQSYSSRRTTGTQIPSPGVV